MKEKNKTFDYSKLKGYMAEKDITQDKLSQISNVSISTINQNLKYGKPFRVENIIEICRVLHISQNEIGYYFFKPKV